MNCAQARVLLGAHLDHELDVRAELELDDHLAGCPECRAELADLKTLSGAAATHLTRFAPSPALEARVAKIGHRPRPRFSWLAGSAVATVAMAAALLVFVRPREDADRRLGDEIIDAHSRSLLADHATDVLSSDQHTVKPWFNGKVPFGVPVADFAAAGFPLAGGRLDYVGRREVAALVYRRRNHLINVFVWPSTAETKASERDERGYVVLNYAHGGLAWWLVSDAGAADLRELSRLLRTE